MYYVFLHAKIHKGAKCDPATDYPKQVDLLQFGNGCGRLWRNHVKAANLSL